MFRPIQILGEDGLFTVPEMAVVFASTLSLYILRFVPSYVQVSLNQVPVVIEDADVAADRQAPLIYILQVALLDESSSSVTPPMSPAVRRLKSAAPEVCAVRFAQAETDIVD